MAGEICYHVSPMLATNSLQSGWHRVLYLYTFSFAMFYGCRRPIGPSNKCAFVEQLQRICMCVVHCAV